MSAIKIALTNKKGWVGKTSTTINLANILSSKKKRVLVIDLDDQCDCTRTILGEDRFDDLDWGDAGDLFDRDSKYSTADLVVKVHKNLSIIPGREEDLFLVEKRIKELQHALKTDFLPDVSRMRSQKDLDSVLGLLERLEERMQQESDKDTSWEKLLKKRLSEIENDYDVILFDLPPSASLVPINAWVASDFLLIPISDELAMKGTVSLIKKMVWIKREHNENIRFLFFYNKVISGKNGAGRFISKGFQEDMETLRQGIEWNPYLKQVSYIMKSTIRHSSSVWSANRAQRPVLDLFGMSEVAKDFKAFAKELESIIQ